MEESVLLGTKPLVDSIHHFILDPSGIFSVCHLCECRIVQWHHDSRLLLLLNWFLHIIKRTLHVGSKIWILCSRGKNIKFISSRHRVISSIYTNVAVTTSSSKLFDHINCHIICYVSTSKVRSSVFLYWPSDRKVNSAKPKFVVSP